MTRCRWATKPEAIAYHDEEWGVPSHDDRHLFEMLILEGAQAGLSWETILKKRAAYRLAYRGFDPGIVAAFDEDDFARLMADAGIVRNRLKIAASIENARAFLEVQGEVGSFGTHVWGFVGGAPIRNAWSSLSQLPASTPESDALSKDLKARGFRFVGTTICYAFMQAVGMVNDHTVDCFRYRAV